MVLGGHLSSIPVLRRIRHDAPTNPIPRVHKTSNGTMGKAGCNAGNCRKTQRAPPQYHQPRPARLSSLVTKVCSSRLFPPPSPCSLQKSPTWSTTAARPHSARLNERLALATHGKGTSKKPSKYFGPFPCRYNRRPPPSQQLINKLQAL